LEIPYSIRGPYRIASERLFDSEEALLTAVLNGECNLRRAEGIKMAYIGSVMFIDGETYDMPMPSSEKKQSSADSTAGSGYTLSVGSALCDNHVVTGDMLRGLLGNVGSVASGASDRKRTSFAEMRFVSSLLRSGFLYPVDI
jgi:hypothetical protein